MSGADHSETELEEVKLALSVLIDEIRAEPISDRLKLLAQELGDALDRAEARQDLQSADQRQ